jgi:hypothetical protein
MIWRLVSNESDGIPMPVYLETNFERVSLPRTLSCLHSFLLRN